MALADRFELNFPLTFGVAGASRTSRALFAPWQRVAETGRPTGKVNFLFLDPDRTFSPTENLAARLTALTAHVFSVPSATRQRDAYPSSRVRAVLRYTTRSWGLNARRIGPDFASPTG
jgi:hypothetical protein